MSTSSIVAASSLTAVISAAFVIPGAWPLAAEMFEDQCDPEAILAAGMKWFDMAGQLNEGKTTAEGAVRGVSEQEWKGKDRQAFEHRMDDYGWQINFSMGMAYVVGGAMVALAIMLFLLILIMAVIALVMLWFMAYVLAAMAGVFTLAPAQAAANNAAIQCFNVLDKVDTVEEKVAIALAAAIGATMAVDVGGQMFKGNSAALGDLGNGFLDASDNLLWGSLSRLERDFNKGLMMTGAKWPFTGHGFTVPSVPRAAGPWAGLTTWGGATGVTPGNVTDNVHGHVPDFNR